MNFGKKAVTTREVVIIIFAILAVLAILFALNGILKNLKLF